MGYGQYLATERKVLIRTNALGKRPVAIDVGAGTTRFWRRGFAPTISPQFPNMPGQAKRPKGIIFSHASEASISR
jgi:hypothetical protein